MNARHLAGKDSILGELHISSTGPIPSDLQLMIDKLSLESGPATNGIFGAPPLEAAQDQYAPETKEAPAVANISASAARLRQLGSVSRVTDAWLYPASAAVKILFSTASGNAVMCSGSLVSPMHVLTAGHCSMSSQTGSFYSTSSYYVIPGQGDISAPFTSDGWSRMFTDKPFGIARVTQATVWGYSRTNSDFGVDFSLLTLDRPIGQRAGTYGLAHSVAAGASVRQRGYPGAGGFNGVFQIVRSGFTITSVESQGTEAFSDLPICAGDSGSPVLDTTNRVVGVAVGLYYVGFDSPSCSGTADTITSAKRLDRAAFNSLTALVSAQTAASPPWRAAVYERFNPSAAGNSGQTATGLTATAASGVIGALKGVGPVVITNATTGAASVPVWWSLWNQGGVASGEITTTFFYSTDPQGVSRGDEVASYVPLGSVVDSTGLGSNRFGAYNATLSLPGGGVTGTFYIIAYFTYREQAAGRGYAEDVTARTIVLGQVFFPAPTRWLCPYAPLTGRSGRYAGDTGTDVALTRQIAAHCQASGFIARLDAGQALLQLDLGIPAEEMGGTLTVSTCDSVTSFRPAVVVMSGVSAWITCPVSLAQLKCRGAASMGINSSVFATAQCAPRTDGTTPMGVSLTVPVTTNSIPLFVLVGGAGTGQQGQFGLSWSYRRPSPTRTPSRSATRSRSASATRKRKMMRA